MRRVSSILFLALALLGVTTGSAIAAAPERSKTTELIVEFPAGLVCDFAVQWKFVAGANELIFRKANGDEVVRTAGKSRATITNLDSDASIVLNGGGRLDLIFHPDGTADIRGNGHMIAGYFPTDVGGPSMWHFRGRLADQVDATFTTVAHDFRGNATDLCAALS